MRDKKLKPITCYLHEELDKELLKWVKSQRNQSASVKEALQLAMEIDKKKKVVIDINSTSAIRSLFSALPLEGSHSFNEENAIDDKDTEIIEDSIDEEEINDILNMINIQR